MHGAGINGASRRGGVFYLFRGEVLFGVGLEFIKALAAAKMKGLPLMLSVVWRVRCHAHAANGIFEISVRMMVRMIPVMVGVFIIWGMFHHGSIRLSGKRRRR